MQLKCESVIITEDSLDPISTIYNIKIKISKDTDSRSSVNGLKLIYTQRVSLNNVRTYILFK